MIEAGHPSEDAGKTTRGRGRPRRFDIDRAFDTAADLFRARGYDRVTLSDLTGAIGINPPSFYAAFGNKALLFTRIADAYCADWLAAVRGCFEQAGPVEQALRHIVADAARRFAWRESTAGSWGGCLILEAANNCSDALVVAHIRKARLSIAAALYRGISRETPEQVVELTDHVMLLLTGLSAMARDGTDGERLAAVAEHATKALSIRYSAG